MLMLEPSAENPLNIEASSYYLSKTDTFDKMAQQSLKGGWISGVHFPSVCLTFNEMAVRNFPPHTKRRHQDDEDDEDDEEEEERQEYHQIINKPRRKRARRKYSIAELRDEEEEEEEQEIDDFHNQYDEDEEDDDTDQSMQLYPSCSSRSPGKKRKYEILTEQANNQMSMAYSRLSLSKPLPTAATTTTTDSMEVSSQQSTEGRVFL
jgi:hypothetical protein